MTTGVDALVRRAQGGDRDAFHELYRAHVGRVYALCLRMTADQVEAEELTQDVFIRAWRKLALFRGDAAFSSWLHRLAANVVLAAKRSEKRQRARVFTTGDPSLFETSGTEPNHDLSMDLERALAALPPRAREVLVLHDIEGYRHREIASMMGIAPGTSKAQLHRARILFREALDG